MNDQVFVELQQVLELREHSCRIMWIRSAPLVRRKSHLVTLVVRHIFKNQKVGKLMYNLLIFSKVNLLRKLVAVF